MLCLFINPNHCIIDTVYAFYICLSVLAVQHNGGSSQGGVVMAETTGREDSHSKSADSSPTSRHSSGTQSYAVTLKSDQFLVLV